MRLVSIVKSDETRIHEALNRAIDLIDGSKSIEGKKNISVKPNLCTPKSPASGTTTDPRIIEALISKINSLTSCEISIVETNNSKATAGQTFNYLGYDALSQRYKNVRCINLSNGPKVRVDISGKFFSGMLVPEHMIFSDCLISVAKLKTHADYLYTGVLKNQYGLLLSRGRRNRYHGFMSKALVDLNRFYKPDLSIVDGIIGMEGFGPTDGNPKRVGVIIASKDPVAADAVAARIIGMNPSKIGYLKYAQKNGIGTWKDIEVVGCNIDEVVTPFAFIPRRYYYFSKIFLALQRYSTYVANFANFVRLTRSALTTVGFSAIEKRMSYSELLHLASDTLFRSEEGSL